MTVTCSQDSRKVFGINLHYSHVAYLIFIARFCELYDLRASFSVQQKAEQTLYQLKII